MIEVMNGEDEVRRVKARKGRTKKEVGKNIRIEEERRGIESSQIY